jgi:transcriptional regulator with XRE-family HTH domain
MAEDQGAALDALLTDTIRLLMTRTGLRQVDVAEVLGVTRGSVSQRLLGQVAWKVADLPAVADLFGVTVCELISGYAAIANADRLPPSRS